MLREVPGEGPESLVDNDENEKKWNQVLLVAFCVRVRVVVSTSLRRWVLIWDDDVQLLELMT